MLAGAAVFSLSLSPCDSLWLWRFLFSPTHSFLCLVSQWGTSLLSFLCRPPMWWYLCGMSSCPSYRHPWSVGVVFPPIGSLQLTHYTVGLWECCLCPFSWHDLASEGASHRWWQTCCSCWLGPACLCWILYPASGCVWCVVGTWDGNC